MQEACDLKLLFATRYTDACYRSIRAVAQLAEAFRLNITIAHVGAAGTTASRELQSFFAEADHYESCLRVQLHGNPATALAEFTRQGHYDLILAPRSDRLGVPRPFHRSFRVQLLAHGETPVWTGSRGLDEGEFLRPYRTIAVGLDNRESDLTHVRLAASFAASVGAKLRLLTVVPTVDEGTLLQTAAGPEPLCKERAIERVHDLLHGWSQTPSVDVAIGSPEREIPRLLAQCEADLLFLSQSQSCTGFLWPQISRTVDQAPCSVVTIPTKLPSQFQWTFLAKAPSARQRLQEMVEAQAARTPSRLFVQRTT